MAGEFVDLRDCGRDQPLDARCRRPARSAIRIMATSPENFSDQTIIGVKDQQQQELLRETMRRASSDGARIGAARELLDRALGKAQYQRLGRLDGREYPRLQIVLYNGN
jgi:hypothetical protein